MSRRSLLNLLLSGALVACAAACNLEMSNGGASSDGTPQGSGGTAARSGGAILCFGDSLTSGGGKITPYPSHLQAMTGRPAISSGAGGETAVRGAARFPGVFNRHRPGAVAIMEGTNDVASGGSLSAAEGALESMVTTAKNGGAQVVLCTIPPFQKGASAANGGVIAFNERVRAVASRQGVALADVYAAFSGQDALTQGDGIHISDAGSRVIAAVVADRL